MLSDAQIERLQASLSRLARAQRDGDGEFGGHGEVAYPPTLKQLFELSGEAGDVDRAMRAIATNPSVHGHLRTAAKASRGKSAAYFAQALAFLPEDTDRVAGSAKLLRSVLQCTRTARTNIFGITQLIERVPEFLRQPFAVVLRGHAASGRPPSGVGVVTESGSPKFFLLEHAALGTLPTAAGAPPRDGDAGGEADADARGDAAEDDEPVADFERVFQSVFDQLDRQSGNHNYVLLHDLRRALPDLPRHEFDAQLNDLRRSKLFSLDSADGRHVRLTSEQLEAGIREASSLLVYVARRAQ